MQLAIPSRRIVVLVSLLLASPAMIFWLWLVIVPAIVAVFCPVECWCCPGGYHVTCHGSLLTTVSLIRLTDIRVMELYDNITLFERDSFVPRGLTEMEKLFVSGCELRTIELGAFNGLKKLTELSITGNEICEIIPGTFESISNLERVDLSYNRLEHLDSGVFSGLFNLEYIHLGDNNLQYLHPDTFFVLPKLKHISFYNNPCLRIPTNHNFINSHSLS